MMINIYPNLIDVPTSYDGHAILTVSLAAVSRALETSSVWAATIEERTPETFKPARYYGMVRAITAGDEVEMPWLYVEDDELAVMDGRHRLYAMIDLGYTDVSVRVDNKYAETVSDLISTACAAL